MKLFLAHIWLPKGAHEGEIDLELPVHLVVALQHDRLRVRREQPVVRARIEAIRVSDLHFVADLRFGVVGPLVHEEAQLEDLVDGVVSELLLVDLVFLVLEVEVEPVKDVQRFD